MGRMRVIILGCGSSGGVPRITGDWGACDPSNPKNRRSRCSILVQRQADNGAETSVLVDTSPDLREQFLNAGIRKVDGVLYTHDHADQCHGIDDLRACAYEAERQIDMYMMASTQKVLRRRFGYIFATPKGSLYPPIAKSHLIEPLQEMTVEGAGGPITALPFIQYHGRIESLGFRFDDFAYVNDLHELPEISAAHLHGLSVLVIDALRYKPHPTHFNVEQALQWAERLKPQRTILTNLHIDLDYNHLVNELPENVEPAHDGMIVDIQA